MSLSSREQQALSSIEDRLSRGDPRLASMLGIFTRLTLDEDMPVWERVRARRWRRPRRSRWPRRVRSAWLRAIRPIRPLRRLAARAGQQRVGLALWVMVASALIAAGVTAGHAGRARSCVARWVATCAGQVTTHPAQPALRPLRPPRPRAAHPPWLITAGGSQIPGR